MISTLLDIKPKLFEQDINCIIRIFRIGHQCTIRCANLIDNDVFKYIVIQTQKSNFIRESPHDITNRITKKATLYLVTMVLYADC